MIPAETVKSVVAQLKDKGTVNRGWIGTQIQPVTAEIAEGLGMKGSEGALVTEPQANGPAAKAGLQAGNIVLSLDGEPVTGADDLVRLLGAERIGIAVTLSVIAGSELRKIVVVPAERAA